MKQSVAEEKIKAAMPGVSAITTPSDVKDVQNSRIRGWKYPGALTARRGQLEEIWVQLLAPPNEGIVAGVFRNVIPQGDERMRVSDLKATYVEKYGPISLEHETVPNMSMIWSWTSNAAGAPVTDWKTIARCVRPDTSNTGASPRTNLMLASRISDAQSYANGNYADCHNFMAVHVLADGRGVVQAVLYCGIST